MQQRPLQEQFAVMYHGKHALADFVGIDAASLYSVESVRVGNKDRILHRPNERLRAYLEFLTLFVFEFLPVHEDAVFSYRKGVNAADAVQRHSAGRHFFVGDLANFFPSVGRELVRATLKGAFARAPVSDLEHWIDRILDFVCVDDGLPVGFPSSPILSNAALFSFDAALLARCEALGLVYTRYSDDLIVSGPEREAVKAIEPVMDELLHAHFHGRLRLNADKTRLLRTGAKVKLLGMVLLPNGKVTVDGRFRSNVEVLLHFYLTDRAKFAQYAQRLARDPDKLEARLSGWLNYINSVDQDYLEKLRRKYGATVVDRFVHRSFG